MGKASVMEAFRIYRIEIKIALANLYHFITFRIALYDIFSSHELNFPTRLTMSTIPIPFYEIFLFPSQPDYLIQSLDIVNVSLYE